jgi:hypothetical protein
MNILVRASHCNALKSDYCQVLGEAPAFGIMVHFSVEFPSESYQETHAKGTCSTNNVQVLMLRTGHRFHWN